MKAWPIGVVLVFALGLAANARSEPLELDGSGFQMGLNGDGTGSITLSVRMKHGEGQTSITCIAEGGDEIYTSTKKQLRGDESTEFMFPSEFSGPETPTAQTYAWWCKIKGHGDVKFGSLRYKVKDKGGLVDSSRSPERPSEGPRRMTVKAFVDNSTKLKGTYIDLGDVWGGGPRDGDGLVTLDVPIEGYEVNVMRGDRLSHSKQRDGEYQTQYLYRVKGIGRGCEFAGQGTMACVLETTK